MVFRTAFAIMSLSAVSVACRRDALAPPQSATEGKRDGSPPLALRPVDLPLEMGSLGKCSIVTYDATLEAPGYRLVQADLGSMDLPVTRGGELRGVGSVHEPGLGRLRYLRWDKLSKRKLVEAVCVIPRTKEADERAAEFLESFQRPAEPRIPERFALAWGDPVVDCFYFPSDDHVECEGEYCTRWATLLAEPKGSQTPANWEYVYICDGGCEVYDFAYYDCSGGGGTVDTTEGGGGQGGGECQNAVVDSLVAEYTDPEYGSDNFYPTCDDFANSGGTLHFSWPELNGGFSSDGNPHEPWGLVQQGLKTGLEGTRTNYNRGGIIINSGYRCPHGNVLGPNPGAPQSYHTHGLAADIRSLQHENTQQELQLILDAAIDAGSTWQLLYTGRVHVDWR